MRGCSICWKLKRVLISVYIDKDIGNFHYIGKYYVCADCLKEIEEEKPMIELRVEYVEAHLELQ